MVSRDQNGKTCATKTLGFKQSKSKKSEENKDNKALLAVQEAKDKGTVVHELGSVQQIQTTRQN